MLMSVSFLLVRRSSFISTRTADPGVAIGQKPQERYQLEKRFFFQHKKTEEDSGTQNCSLTTSNDDDDEN